MSDTDELQRVLADATGLHGDVRVRGTAARSVRARARQRRVTAVGSGAAAALVCVVVGLLALTGGEGDGRTAVPAAPVASAPRTTQPSPPALPEVAPGPQRLGSPIEVRPVRTEYLNCAVAPARARTVPAVYGTACYRLAAPWFVIDRLDGVDVTFASDENGLVSETNGQLVLTMNRADRAVFAARTGTQIGRQVALVVGGQVWFAPSIGSPIDGGQVSLDLPVLRLRGLLAALELSPA